MLVDLRKDLLYLFPQHLNVCIQRNVSHSDLLNLHDIGVGEPVSFTKIAFGSGKYELSWEQPRTGYGSVKNYTIFWCTHDRDRPYQCSVSLFVSSCVLYIKLLINRAIYDGKRFLMTKPCLTLLCLKIKLTSLQYQPILKRQVVEWFGLLVQLFITKLLVKWNMYGFIMFIQLQLRLLGNWTAPIVLAV